MRSPLFAACLLVLAACSPAPRPTPEVMPEVAAEYGAIYNDWDEARLLALYLPDAKIDANHRQHFAWLHEQLGECGAPEFMWSFGKRGARFSYPCERGALEAAFILDATGHIVTTRSGAAEVPASPALLAAANAVLASMPWTLDTLRPFKHNLNLYGATRFGRCELARPWVVGQHGALLHVRCDAGPAVLRLYLHKDGTIASVELLPGESYKGPPIE